MDARIINISAPIGQLLCPVTLPGALYQGEVAAHKFVVTATTSANDPTPVTLSGTVTAKFVRADGATEAINGTINDGKAEVTLTQDCYNVPGRFTLSIFVASSGVTVCSCAVTGNVIKTTTGTVVDSGSVMPDYTEILAVYDDLQDALSAAETSVGSATAASIDSSSSTVNIWTQGSLSVSTGQINSATNRCRSGNTFIRGNDLFFGGVAIIKVKEGYGINVLAYNSPQIVEGSFAGALYNEFQTGYVIITEGSSAAASSALWYRITLTRTDNADFTPAQIPDGCVVWSKSDDDLVQGLADRNIIDVALEQGMIKASDGTENTSAKRCRSGWIFGADLFHNGEAQIEVDDDYGINIFMYTTCDTTVNDCYVGAMYPNFQPGTIRLAASTTIKPEYWYRIVVARLDDANFGPTDVPSYGVAYLGGKRGFIGKDRPTDTPVYKLVRFFVPVDLAPNGSAANITNVRCIVQLPANYKPTGKPTPLIMIGHGSSGFVAETNWGGTKFRTLVDFFCDAGYALFDVDNTLAEHTSANLPCPDCGCLTLMQSYIAAWNYIKEHYNVSDDLLILSNSMGTYAAMNMLKWYPGMVRTAILCAPRVSIAEYYNRSGTTDAKKAHVRTVFGWPSGVTDYSAAGAQAAMRGWDNYLDLYTLDDVQRVNREFPPIKVMVGLDDTNGLTEVQNYFAALSRSGNMVAYSETAGRDHTEMCYLYDGDDPDATLRAEALQWLNRFV